MKKFLLTLMVVVSLVLGIGIMNADAATYTGNCGENCSWELDCETGVLTISGSGAMDNYSLTEAAPWSEASK